MAGGPSRVVFRTQPGVVLSSSDIQPLADGGLLRFQVPRTIAGRAKVRWLFSSMPALADADVLRINRLTAGALTASTKPKEYYYSYFAADVSSDVDAHQIADALKTSPDIAIAYVDPSGIEPSRGVDPDDPLLFRQTYLGPAGIDVSTVWPGQRNAVDGAAGAGVQLVDIERGWSPHGDLPRVLPPLHGDVLDDIDVKRHGTAALLIACAQDNRAGGLGIAPQARALAVSYFSESIGENRALAITQAVDRLRPGDVLLLEVQLNEAGFPPVEAVQADFDAIRLAVRRRIIVIEPAGNGGIDLDAFRARDRRVLNPTSPEFEDSGAILVGAGDAHSRERVDSSNFGTRVDSFAWGSGVFASPAMPNFGETSAASAIVAGAVAAIQGAARASARGLLTPAEMRALLRCSNLNQSSANGAEVDRIGFMPKVRAIVQSF